MGFLANLRAGLFPTPEERAGLVQIVETLGRQPLEDIGTDFQSFVQRGYKDNGIIWACIAARLTVFAQGRFELVDKNDRSNTSPLPPRMVALEQPWVNGSQSELLARIEQDTSLAGNYYIYLAAPGPNGLQRLRPDWVDIMLDRGGKEVIGYLYHEGGRNHTRAPKVLLPEEVAHGSPYPDPLKGFRGSSWLTTVTREVLGDTAMNNHKRKFFENAATPNLILSFMNTLSERARAELETALRQKHTGIENAYSSLIIEEGGDAKVVGSTMQQIQFDLVQAAGENRIAVAAQVPSVVLGIKEGGEQATYSNYGQALRHFANFPMQHAWTHVADTLKPLFAIPEGKLLSVGTRHIPALQIDQKEHAEIIETQTVAIAELIGAGFEPESAVAAVTRGELKGLKHTGDPVVDVGDDAPLSLVAP